MGALEEEDDDIYEVEKKHDYDRSVTDDGAGEGQFGWTGPHSIGDRWTMECFVKASKMPKPAKVRLSVCLYIEGYSRVLLNMDTIGTTLMCSAH